MSSAKQGEAILRRFALSYPSAYEDFPWGESVIKVGKKVFVFLGVASDGLHMSVKLPQSASLALSLPFASPTGYNLGKSGWVTSRFGSRDKPPLPVLRQWIDESYRAVAPKRLVATLPSGGVGPPRMSKTRRSKSRARARRKR
ncbi:MAG TPA: MmcQ/YjbR family DNA-binding protein [Vicinamibacteria bacterium]|jgi:predicted DNA-binding protein (MmcQ/YjbR family)|nr:MmcQ/YjbR family DNA-binding protein [Vicinamibacteria bacterium]